MKILTTVAATALATIALSASAQAARKGGKCVTAGGSATMITEDLAKYMAGAALKNSMTSHGWQPHGAVKMKCGTENGLPHCTARQRACG